MAPLSPLPSPRIMRNSLAPFPRCVLLLIGWLAAAPARADVVLDWTALMIDAIRLDTTGPTLSTRNLAMLHLAMYDALNAIDARHQPYRVQAAPPAGADPEIAVVGAAYEILKILYPNVQARADSLYEDFVTAHPATAVLTNSLAYGAGVGGAMLDDRSEDGSATQVPYIPSELPGRWRRTPPFYRPPLDPQWRYVTPFALPDIEPFVPPGPPALSSDEYARDFNEVKAIGAKNSATRTPEQSQIAVFWSDFSYTAMPPGHWHEIAMTIARTQGNTLAQNARLFALLSLAQADGAIVCWEAKYRFDSWRPITAIQRADEDGNPATAPDPGWQHYLNAPNFPEYTSGHSTFSKASATVLAAFYATDQLEFNAASDSLPGVERHFTSLSACADEIGMSRIYGGIHFTSANRYGKACGAKVAAYVLQNWLQPNAALPCVTREPATNGIPCFRAHGHAGRTLVVDASADMVVWTPMATNTAVPGGIVITESPAGAARARFFRAREN